MKTTDIGRSGADRGNGTSETAVEGAFGWNGVEYAMLVKRCGTPIDTSQNPTAPRYSPPEVVAIERRWIMGNPDIEAISTSFVERQNLTMGMNIRRLTRLTNGIPRRWRITFRRWRCISSNNFCRPHRMLTKAHPRHYPVSPAMAAGRSDHVWKLEEVVSLLEVKEALWPSQK